MRPPIEVPIQSTLRTARRASSASTSARNWPKWYSSGVASQSLSPRPGKSMQTTRASRLSSRARKSKSRALPL